MDALGGEHLQSDEVLRDLALLLHQSRNAHAPGGLLGFAYSEEQGA